MRKLVAASSVSESVLTGARTVLRRSGRHGIFFSPRSRATHWKGSFRTRESKEIQANPNAKNPGFCGAPRLGCGAPRKSKWPDAVARAQVLGAQASSGPSGTIPVGLRLLIE